MTRLCFLACLLCLGCAVFAGCAEPPDETSVSFTVRGQYLGPAYDGAVAVISHEAIPGFMEAMQMPFRIEESVSLDSLREGDKIRFLLADRGNGYRIDSIRVLPPDTPLTLVETSPPDSLSNATP